MTTAEWISTLALVISTSGFTLQARNWWMSGPRLHLSAMVDAIVFPDDGKGTRLSLTVINRGTEATMLTHQIVFIYESWWDKYRSNPKLSGVVNAPGIPSKLDVNATWMGQMFYDHQTREALQKRQLYVGVIASHSNKYFLIRPKPPAEAKVPSETVAKG